MDGLDMQTIFTSKPFMSIVMMLAIKYAGVEVSVPTARISYAACMASVALFLLLMLVFIRAAPEGPKVTAKEIDTATNTCAPWLSCTHVCGNRTNCARRACEYL